MFLGIKETIDTKSLYDLLKLMMFLETPSLVFLLIIFPIPTCAKKPFLERRA